MSALSAALGTPGSGPVPGQVFRSELNPVDFLHRAAYIYPDKTAVVDGERRYSYRQLAERSWRLANALRSAGLAKGDRVATLLFNSPAMLEAHFGVPAAGGILVAVNHRLAGAEIGYILRHSGELPHRARVRPDRDLRPDHRVPRARARPRASGGPACEVPGAREHLQHRSRAGN